MPMFYFVPFKFKSSAEGKSDLPVVDLGSPRDMFFYVLMGLILLGMFAAFIVVPAILVMRQAIPAG